LASKAYFPDPEIWFSFGYQHDRTWPMAHCQQWRWGFSDSETQSLRTELSDRNETGSCFCGAVRAEINGEPFWICYDHDDDCRRALGSPLTVWVGYRPDQFRYTKGAPKTFSKTMGVIRSFCQDCGTSISYRDEGLSDELYITIGFLDHPERYKPNAHAYWRLRLPWLEFSDNLPRNDTYTRHRDPEYGTPADRAR
jgi:hypothetical protein